MKAFRGFVVKEFSHIIRDVRTMVVLFGMPVIMLVLFGYAIRNEVDSVDVAVLDYSHDQVTRQLIERIRVSDAMNLTGALRSDGEIEALFKKGTVKQVIVFESEFQEKLERTGRADIQLISDASNPNLASLLQEYTSAIIRDFEREVAAGNIAAAITTEPTRVEFTTKGATESVGIPVTTTGTTSVFQEEVLPQVIMMFNPGLRSVNLFVPGLIAVILMLVSALMTSISLTKEKETGTMEVLLVSPLKPQHIVIGKVVPYLLLSLVNVVSVLLLARWIFGVPFNGSLILFMAEAFLFIVVALSLGVLISAKAPNQQTALMVALAGLLLPTVLLSGFIFPISSMPLPLQTLSHMVPAKWFLVIVRSIMLKGSGFEMIWKETLILACMGLVIIGAGVKSFKTRLE